MGRRFHRTVYQMAKAQRLLSQSLHCSLGPSSHQEAKERVQQDPERKPRGNGSVESGLEEKAAENPFWETSGVGLHEGLSFKSLEHTPRAYFRLPKRG